MRSYHFLTSFSRFIVKIRSNSTNFGNLFNHLIKELSYEINSRIILKGTASTGILLLKLQHLWSTEYQNNEKKFRGPTKWRFHKISSVLFSVCWFDRLLVSPEFFTRTAHRNFLIFCMKKLFYLFKVFEVFFFEIFIVIFYLQNLWRHDECCLIC